MENLEIDGVQCWGELSDSSNIEVMFSDEHEDFIWLNRDPERQPDWAACVDKWKAYADRMGVELWEMACDD